MGITFHGRSTKRKREITTEFVDWALLKLIPSKRKRDKLELVIEFASRLPSCREAVCIYRDANAFTIRVLAKVPLNETIISLGHELTHVKQWVMGEMIDVGGDRVMWRGKAFPIRPQCPKWQAGEYWESPWEIEAFGRQVTLYNHFLYYIGYESL